MADQPVPLRHPSIAALEAALAALPAEGGSPAPAAALRGEILRRKGEWRAAIAELAVATAAVPDWPDAEHCLALACLQGGEPERGRAVLEALLRRHPDDAVARFQIALCDEHAGRTALALRGYEDQTARHPRFVPAWVNLGRLRLANGDAAGAIAALEQAVQRDPRHAAAWLALGDARARLGRHREAVAAWLRAAEHDPRAHAPLERAAAALAEAADLPGAGELYRRAIEREPRLARLHWAAAAVASSLGEHATALAAMREAQSLDPGNAEGESAILLELQYDDAFVSRRDLALAHWQWGDRHAPPRIQRAAASAGRADARLRIGYLSPRFTAGPLAVLLLPVLEARDRTAFHLTLYSAHAHGDRHAAAFRATGDAWRELPADDEAAAAVVAADHLDLLVDLAGHAPGHRLGMLARRPAPVQATWLDYFETTGLTQVDFLLGDAQHTPLADAPLFRERLVLLDPCRYVYRPPVIVPRTTPPALRRGHVTFGSFNRHAKITPAMLEVWCRILAAVPRARLALRASAYSSESTVSWIRAEWARRSVPVDRIDFLPYLPLAQALASYAEVDIALDTSPYNGGVTTCDALVHGVPVVTLAGERMVSRQGAALLHAAGHPEWIATTPDAYVACAVTLADPATLARVRAALQEEVPASALCDTPRFVRKLETAWRRMIEEGPGSDVQARPRAPILAA